MDKTEADKFAWTEWIISEREKHEWSQAALARKVGVTRQTINDYESRRRTQPDEKILVKISQAFGFHPEYLPRMAGLLPPALDHDPWVEKMTNKLHKLSPELRSVADGLIDSLVQQEEANQKVKPKPRSART